MRSPWVALLMLFLMAGCENENPVSESDDEMILGSDNQEDYGRPKKIHIVSTPEDQKWVTFGVITDSHVDGSCGSCSTTDRIGRNQRVIHDINIDAYKKGCYGVVHLGDMVDSNNTQNLVAFRQLYEEDYPGHDGGAVAWDPTDSHDAYSEGHRINKPVFASLGNHDDPPYPDGDKDWRKSAHYLNDRIIDAPGVISSYKKVNYAWRWGMYYFIQLGEWAGSYEHESNTEVDEGKLRWLKEFLEETVGDSNFGVIILQHYGWDHWASESRWWSSSMREKELAVLTRRENADDTARPYNIIGIFTGHSHSEHHMKVFAGLDAVGDSVFFDNIVFRDSGASHKHFGFSIVTLDGDGGYMLIQTKDVGTGKWTEWKKSISVGS